MTSSLMIKDESYPAPNKKVLFVFFIYALNPSSMLMEKPSSSKYHAYDKLIIIG